MSNPISSSKDKTRYPSIDHGQRDRETRVKFPSIQSMEDEDSIMKISQNYRHTYKQLFNNSLHSHNNSSYYDNTATTNSQTAQASKDTTQIQLLPLKSMEDNAKLIKKSKDKYEEQQKRIFDMHMRYISRSQSSLDKLTNSLAVQSEASKLQQLDINDLGNIDSINSSLAISSTFKSPRIRSLDQGNKDSPNKIIKKLPATERRKLPENLQENVVSNYLNNINNGEQKKNLKKDQKINPAAFKSKESNEPQQPLIIRTQIKQPSILLSPVQNSSANLSPSFGSPLHKTLSGINFFPLERRGSSRLNRQRINNFHEEIDGNAIIASAVPIVTELNISKNDSPQSKTKVRNRKIVSFQQFEDTYNAQNQICSNIEEKFNFFKQIPVGSLITLTKKQLEDEEKGSFSHQYANQQEQMRDKKSSKSIYKKMQSKESLKESEQTPSMVSPKAKIFKNSEYQNILAKQEQIQREAKKIQESKFCVMSQRMNIFFNDESNRNLFHQLCDCCRNLNKCVDILQKLETNNNKNINLLNRLCNNKAYLMNSIIDQQFKRIQQENIDSFENLLINENTINNYFKPDNSLHFLISTLYVKDINYINNSLQDFLNKSQLYLADKLTHIIKAEFTMVKQKEKDIILSQLLQNGLKNMREKKSYTFFNQYLYNIEPRRNTYKEIQDFERNYGSFSYLNQIERDMFVNLEKQFQLIRTSNQV